MRKHRKKLANVERANKRRVNKKVGRKKKFAIKVNNTASMFSAKDPNLTMSQAKQKALQFISI